ncbi:DUF6233 domain-containing protein [Streptomyces sp. NBC_00199]|uniref:DUF6233 domain-containing protein n=1 Tax=Streptomyces sp. NBC_00199 TaxID=2975678 RepID=UPI0022531925|nr:DUF6233 domain-containing protein [Streptomyces sp. NBC_00199]MCX5265841.1 DUF6233 domain-containing protein [Streptomyces sp. NBC_00199]
MLPPGHLLEALRPGRQRHLGRHDRPINSRAWAGDFGHQRSRLRKLTIDLGFPCGSIGSPIRDARGRSRPIAPPRLDRILPAHLGVGETGTSRPRGIGRQEAQRRLAEGVPDCSHCRPDSELGFLDG